ncbi:MAG: hypothetical protein CSA03_03510 [Bacteroidetes bacterium]|nr:MAG: hypothetical protein CSA03_03510 [Bacteroidota bacterium]
MKKALFIGVFGMFGIMALASCKKDYICNCTVNGNEATLQIKDAKKKDAQDACDDAEATYAQAGTASCTLDAD